MLPKDDQEMEELMLEEVEVFKVGMTHSPVLLTPALLTSDLRPPDQGREGVPSPQANPCLLPGPSTC